VGKERVGEGGGVPKRGASSPARKGPFPIEKKPENAQVDLGNKKERVSFEINEKRIAR